MGKSLNSPVDSILQRILILCLFCFVVSPAFAQNQNTNPRDPEIQKFLNTQEWILKYTVTVKGSGSGPHWNASVERVINGTMDLGLRSQGPSLSMPNIAPTLTSPEAMNNMIGNYANWMYGVIDANGEVIQQSVLQSMKANEHYAYKNYGESPGVCGESDGPCGWETHREYAEGTGEVTFGGNFAFEIDGEHKKFNFLFDALIFHDSEQSSNALVGESISNEGTDRENRQPIKMGLDIKKEEFESIDPPWDNGPMGANIVGNLPAAYGPISGQSLHAVKIKYAGTTIPGTLSVDYMFSPKTTESAELLIIPPSNYEQWRPMGDKDEKTSGDWIPIKVKLQKPGGGDPKFKAVRFNYKLKNVSHEKGVCMNSPKTPDPDNPPDLQFEGVQNPTIDIIKEDKQTAIQSFEGDYLTEGSVVVSSFDYGAYGDLEVTAELENGEVVEGIVQGTGKKQLRLPDRNDDSWIAKVFLKNLGNLPDTDDNENDPEGDGFKGDGLSLYEEYRGFMDGGSWITADPKKKDVFVFNEMRGMAKAQRGIDVFEKATGLVVHRHILTKQVSYDMVINFNKNDKTHIVDQHVIRLIPGPAMKLRGRTAHVENVGTPGTAKSVTVPVDWEEFRQVGKRSIPAWERTQAHEMSHDCNIYHHGESDTTVRWEYDSSVSPNVVEIGPAGRSIVTLKKEDGSILQAEDFFPRTIKNGEGYNDIPMGVEHGQHSGVEDCLMRYWIAWAYPSVTEPDVRYLSPGEIRGTILCTTASGTGINAPGHKPQSRFGTAATPANGKSPWVKDNRGNCKHQLRVNDLGAEPKR